MAEEHFTSIFYKNIIFGLYSFVRKAQSKRKVKNYELNLNCIPVTKHRLVPWGINIIPKKGT